MIFTTALGVGLQRSVFSGKCKDVLGNDCYLLRVCLFVHDFSQAFQTQLTVYLSRRSMVLFVPTDSCIHCITSLTVLLTFPSSYKFAHAMLPPKSVVLSSVHAG